MQVFYEQLNYEKLSESQAYGFVNLLADFGGQMGLWVGMSFLTCCEILFLAFETLVMVIDGARKRRAGVPSGGESSKAGASHTSKAKSHKSKYEN